MYIYRTKIYDNKEKNRNSRLEQLYIVKTTEVKYGTVLY